MAPEDERVPVTFLAGFLGSGKTTLVNRVLREPHGLEIAVVVNEFGDVGIDGELVVGSEDSIVQLENGCLCCTVRGDLVETLKDLGSRRRRRWFGRARFDRVLIEASGLASPGPALQTVLVDPELAATYRVDGVITLAHAARIEAALTENPEAAEQVGYADRILLNHCDRVDADGAARAEAALRACNAVAPVLRTRRADADVGALLSIASGDPGSWHGPSDASHGAGGHTSGVGTVVLETEGSLDLHRLKMWLQFVAAKRDQELMRLKGIVRCADHGPAVVVQAVYQWLELGPGEMPAPTRSRLVLIGRGLDRAELERGWAACTAEPGRSSSR